MNQGFIIRRWSVWPLIDNEDRLDSLSEKELLSSLPKMLKRRLSPLAKIVFCAANQCLDKKLAIPTIFSSSHGELTKSFKMMELIEQGEDISPTAFSLSVHNSIAGLFSMAYQNKTQSTVVAPGEEGIAAAFIEALGLFSEGEEEVLIVFYDEPLPNFYPTMPFLLTANYSIAVALHVTKSGPGTPVQFSCLANTGDNGEQPIQVPLLIDFLADKQTRLLINTPRHSWCLEKR